MGRFSSLKIALWSSGVSSDRERKLCGRGVSHGLFLGGKKRAMILFGPGPPCLKRFTLVT